MTCELIKQGLSGKCACGAQLEGDCHVIKDQRGVLDLKCKICCRVCTTFALASSVDSDAHALSFSGAGQ